MVIKGKARGGASALAAHLQRHDTNEVIRLREFEGVTARSVLGALREMDAMGSGAASQRTLYHAAINTAPGERLTDDQKRHAVDRLADELGFKGQPRIVVEHVKKDREHMHVVYMRVDLDRMVAIPDSHNYRKHEAVARNLEREFGHQHVQGAHVDRAGQERPQRTPGHDEMQQADRTGLMPKEATQRVTQLWNQADSGKAFAAAVTADGWVLARGDKRDFVLVDRAGETHSLARRVDGAKAADIRQRMSDVDPETLPKVTEAKEMQRHQAEAGRSKEKEKSKAPHHAAVAPVLLKVEAPASQSFVEPLAIAEASARPLPRKPAPAPAETHQVPANPASKKLRKAGPLKRIYTAAAATTQRAIEKARGVLDKKKDHPIPNDRPARPAKDAPQLTPAQLAMKRAREASRAADRQATSKPIEKPQQPEQAKANDNQSERVSGRRRNLSGDEIEMLLERQRRQRGHDGPSR